MIPSRASIWKCESAARGGEARCHWLVSAMKPAGNELLAFREELLNQEIQERIFTNGRRDPGEQAEVAKSVSVSEQRHQLHALDLRFNDNSKVPNTEEADERRGFQMQAAPELLDVKDALARQTIR